MTPLFFVLSALTRPLYSVKSRNSDFRANMRFGAASGPVASPAEWTFHNLRNATRMAVQASDCALPGGEKYSNMDRAKDWLRQA
jgi:hypothetical protein